MKLTHSGQLSILSVTSRHYKSYPNNFGTFGQIWHIVVTFPSYPPPSPHTNTHRSKTLKILNLVPVLIYSPSPPSLWLKRKKRKGVYLSRNAYTVFNVFTHSSKGWAGIFTVFTHWRSEGLWGELTSYFLCFNSSWGRGSSVYCHFLCILTIFTVFTH